MGSIGSMGSIFVLLSSEELGSPPRRCFVSMLLPCLQVHDWDEPLVLLVLPRDNSDGLRYNMRAESKVGSGDSGRMGDSPDGETFDSHSLMRG